MQSTPVFNLLHNVAANADVDSFRVDLFPYEITVDSQPDSDNVHLRILPCAQFTDARAGGRYPKHFSTADKRSMQDPITFVGDVDKHTASVLIRAITTQLSHLPIDAIKA